MKPRLFWFWLLCILLHGCAGNPPPAGHPVEPIRTFGVTVRSTDGDLIAPSGVIVVDSGDRLIGTNRDGRLQFETTLPVWGGWLTVEADGYQSVVARVALADMEDIALERPIAPLKRLRVDGRNPITDDGHPFVWRFVTGFRLVDYVADGSEGAAITFLDWAKQTGFNGVRVLSSLCCWFDLAPEDGQLALGRTLELAQARGLYLEVVALAGTQGRGLDRAAIAAHVRAVGLICERSPACASVELANENAHPSQRSELTDLAFLKTLRSLITNTVLVSMGSNCCGQSDEKVIYDGGEYVTVHRDRTRGLWDRTRHIREQEVVSDKSGKFVVDDEPKGAGEVDSGSRSANPHEFYATGVLSRIFGVGATFHCEDCLQAKVPGPIQQLAAEAFVSGTQIVPDSIRLHFENATWSTSPVKGAHFGDYGKPDSVVRVYTGVGAMTVSAQVGVSGDPRVEYQHGWRAERVLADRPGIRVVELVR